MWTTSSRKLVTIRRTTWDIVKGPPLDFWVYSLCFSCASHMSHFEALVPTAILLPRFEFSGLWLPSRWWITLLHCSLATWNSSLLLYCGSILVTRRWPRKRCWMTKLSLERSLLDFATWVHESLSLEFLIFPAPQSCEFIIGLMAGPLEANLNASRVSVIVSHEDGGTSTQVLFPSHDNTHLRISCIGTRMRMMNISLIMIGVPRALIKSITAPVPHPDIISVKNSPRVFPWRFSVEERISWQLLLIRRLLQCGK